MLEHDVLVVGGGFAGMRAAISAKSAGADVAVVSKVHPLRSHSCGAHSGINAALGSGDSWESHAHDTIRAGDYLADQDAVEILCREAVEDVIQLEHMGVIFSRDGQGYIDVMPFAGSSQARTCYVGDSAGHIILQVLYEQLLKWEVPTYHEWFVTSLLMEDGTCRGAIAQELSSGTLQPIHSKAVVLATGGLGRIYQPSTASLGATADGMALAYRAGVPLMDMEMVQYHPTTLKGRGVVITEAARGEGAHLVNNKGDRFMPAYAPEMGDLSTRDLCSRVVQTEINEGRGVDGCVWLDFRHLDKDRMDDRLPETALLVKRLAGIDIAEETVPVQPAMHRSMGGVRADTGGATPVPGLYAAGECACVGVHGANRLGGNSLLDSVVYGRRAGESAATYAAGSTLAPASDSVVEDEEKRVRGLAGRGKGNDTIGSVRRELALTMNQNAGMYRNGPGLAEAAAKISELKERYTGIALPDAGGPYNPSLSTHLELRNMLDVAEVIVAGALSREESRGTHYRTDFPTKDDEWLKHTLASHAPDGPSLDYRPVTVTQWQP